MPRYSNLISESLLVNDTVAFLRARGGRASAVKVIDHVMRIRKPARDLARILAEDLAERDPRLVVDDEFVYLVNPDHEARDLFDTGYVVFDLETTGAKAPPCRITEIGAYRVKNGVVMDNFHTLVNPETTIPPFIVGLTGITDEMVRDAPKFREVAADLLEFIGDSVLVAHNARFDIGFLNHEIGRVYEDYRIANASLCTVQLSRKLLPDIENHKLKTVASHYSVELLHHHRAGDDAHATAWIFVNLLNLLRSHGIQNIGGARKFTLKKQLC
jgi:DNA polymerase-3 subunit alpha (Gram-positive type)